MRQVFAALLLLVFGASLPFGAGAMRLCLLENRILFSTSDECPAEQACCDDCDTNSTQHDGMPCCLEVKKLPDSNLPSSPNRVPAFFAVELPTVVFAPIIPPVDRASGHWEIPNELRAQPPPSTRRALLGIWTI